MEQVSEWYNIMWVIKVGHDEEYSEFNHHTVRLFFHIQMHQSLCGYPNSSRDALHRVLLVCRGWELV